jgi:hypothetical protein
MPIFHPGTNQFIAVCTASANDRQEHYASLHLSKRDGDVVVGGNWGLKAFYIEVK